MISGSQLQAFAAEARPAKFWHFAGAVIAGSAGSALGGYLAGKAVGDQNDEARRMTKAFVGIGLFWIIGGLTWVKLSSETT